MEKDPVLVQPEGAIRFIALGSAGAVFQASNHQVLKTSIKLDVTGRSQQVVEHAEHQENYSELCINREKLIYRALPKESQHPRVPRHHRKRHPLPLSYIRKSS